MNWKDLLDNWYCGIPLSTKELKFLSRKLKDKHPEKFWIKEELSTRN